MDSFIYNLAHQEMAISQRARREKAISRRAPGKILPGKCHFPLGRAKKWPFPDRLTDIASFNKSPFFHVNITRDHDLFCVIKIR